MGLNPAKAMGGGGLDTIVLEELSAMDRRWRDVMKAEVVKAEVVKTEETGSKGSRRVNRPG